jgi:hypothetical protein
MGTLSPYPWDLSLSGQQDERWDSHNCPNPVGTRVSARVASLRCPTLCLSSFILSVTGLV